MTCNICEARNVGPGHTCNLGGEVGEVSQWEREIRRQALTALRASTASVRDEFARGAVAKDIAIAAWMNVVEARLRRLEDLIEGGPP